MTHTDTPLIVNLYPFDLHPGAMIRILMKNYLQGAKCHNWRHV